jgi:hypothetical protein
MTVNSLSVIWKGKMETNITVSEGIFKQSKESEGNKRRAVLLRRVNLFIPVHDQAGARGGAVFEALRYKPEGRGFDSRWCHWNFSLA